MVRAHVSLVLIPWLAGVGCHADFEPRGDGSGSATGSSSPSDEFATTTGTDADGSGSAESDTAAETDGDTTAATETTVGSTGVAPECGDGTVDPGEGCDDGNTEPGDGCHDDCTEYRTAFVSERIGPGALDGLAGADRTCMEEAFAAGLDGDYRAWLSIPDEAAADRHVHATVAYRRVDGILVAEHWDDLVDGMLAAPIDKTAAGADVGDVAVWTGTGSQGNTKGQSCTSWTSGMLGTSGRIGIASMADASWTDFGEQFCSLSARVYCFEQ